MTEKPETFEGDGQQKFFHPEPHTQGIEDSRKRQPPKNLADGMIKALRPKQWVKTFWSWQLLQLPVLMRSFTPAPYWMWP